MTVLQTNRLFFSGKWSTFRTVSPWANGPKMTGDPMQCFTIQKFPQIQSGIRVECVPNLNGNPEWVARVGREATNSLLTQIPVPSEGRILPDNGTSNWGTLKYLENNLAKYLILIRDQSPSKGVSRIDFTHAVKPIAAGYVGKGPRGTFGGGFEYLAVLHLGQYISFTIVHKGSSSPTLYTLVAANEGLRFMHGVIKKQESLCPPSIINLEGNGSI